MSSLFNINLTLLIKFNVSEKTKRKLLQASIK